VALVPKAGASRAGTRWVAGPVQLRRSTLRSRKARFATSSRPFRDRPDFDAWQYTQISSFEVNRPGHPGTRPREGKCHKSQCFTPGRFTPLHPTGFTGSKLAKGRSTFCVWADNSISTVAAEALAREQQGGGICHPWHSETVIPKTQGRRANCSRRFKKPGRAAWNSPAQLQALGRGHQKCDPPSSLMVRVPSQALWTAPAGFA
jgi:hypothetical protein